MKPLIVLLALLLVGCAKDIPPATSINMAGPPPEWKAPAPPLPVIPNCNGMKGKNQRIACRAEYDRAVRRMYVDLAHKHESLAGFVDRMNLAPPVWKTETSN